jgi:hypothetical protein
MLMVLMLGLLLPEFSENLYQPPLIQTPYPFARHKAKWCVIAACLSANTSDRPQFLDLSSLLIRLLPHSADRAYHTVVFYHS